MNVYLYDNDLNQLGSELNVQGSSGNVKNALWSLNEGETYYIKVSGAYYSSYNSGSYWIALNSSGMEPN